VTRFGEFLSLWQDVKNIGNFEAVYLVFGKLFNLLWQILYANGENFNVGNSQIFYK